MGTPFQEQGPNPLTAGMLQSNNLEAGPPPVGWQPLGCSVSCHCPPLASSSAVLCCQQLSTCSSAGPHQSLGSAPSRMLTTCSVRCPACLRNGTMRTLSFPAPWRSCCWIFCAIPTGSFQQQPELLCTPLCLLGYCISPPMNKEAISSLSFTLRVKLLTKSE